MDKITQAAKAWRQWVTASLVRMQELDDTEQALLDALADARCGRCGRCAECRRDAPFKEGSTVTERHEHRGPWPSPEGTTFEFLFRSAEGELTQFATGLTEQDVAKQALRILRQHPDAHLRVPELSRIGQYCGYRLRKTDTDEEWIWRPQR